MKQLIHAGLGSDKSSPPVRGRGLKRGVTLLAVEYLMVAPRAGAWIETSDIHDAIQEFIVAPRAGAWIETRY